MTFLSGTGVPVGVDVLTCNVNTILCSFGVHIPDKEKKITFAMHSHKISTPTGTPVPDEKV